MSLCWVKSFQKRIEKIRYNLKKSEICTKTSGDRVIWLIHSIDLHSEILESAERITDIIRLLGPNIWFVQWPRYFTIVGRWTEERARSRITLIFDWLWWLTGMKNIFLETVGSMLSISTKIGSVRRCYCIGLTVSPREKLREPKERAWSI